MSSEQIYFWMAVIVGVHGIGFAWRIAYLMGRDRKRRTRARRMRLGRM